MASGISKKVQEWLTGRGISPANAEDMKIYTGRRLATGVVEPDSVAGGVIVFPFYENGVVVDEKYRESGKKFSKKPGGRRVFYNCDIIDDPQLVEGRAALVITEGELDLLAVKEAGNPFVVSVPDGAPAKLKEEPESIDPEDDGKFQFVFNNWEKLKRVKRIVIAADNDEPGRILGEELVRRLGRARCSFVQWPDGIKDMNELLLIHGPAAVAECIANAKPYPVSGVYQYSEIPPEPALTPKTTGFHRLDPYILPFYPSLMVVTGFAGSGKSSFVNQMVANFAILHGWRAAIASFEMRVTPFIDGTLINTYMDYYDGKGGTVAKAKDWINDKFVFIAPEPSDDTDSFDIEWLIERAVTAVVRYGIRVLVIDPWNEIEHAVRRGESLTDYTGRAIRALKRFGREFECLVIVVAHPTKRGAEKQPNELSLYDVSDSAHFANKADFGVIIARQADLISEVMIKKVRYQPTTGSLGSVFISFDPARRIFNQV